MNYINRLKLIAEESGDIINNKSAQERTENLWITSIFKNKWTFSLKMLLPIFNIG